MRGAVPAGVLVLACAATAFAAEDDPDTEIAQRHFEKGAAFYQQRDYVHALQEFQAARRAHPAAAFDFNIGRCHDRLEQLHEAIEAYRRYVEWKPTPSDAAEVRARITALEARLGASTPASTPGAVSARGHFEAGRVYAEHGDLRRALNEFRESARDLDVPALDYNLARTWDRLGDAVHAVASYERYLARSPNTDDRPEVEKRIGELKPKIGTLTVVSRVSGATLLIDEEPIATATLGLAIPLTEGPHKLVARKEGHLSRAVDVRIEGGKSITVELDPIAPVAAPAPRRRPLWLIGVGAGVVVVAVVATVLGVVLAPAPQAMPFLGSVSPGVQRIMP
jgi:tetratricopeptide (TPR) repeat protein